MLHDRSYSGKHSPWWEQPDNSDYLDYLLVKFGPMPHFVCQKFLCAWTRLWTAQLSKILMCEMHCYALLQDHFRDELFILCSSLPSGCPNSRHPLHFILPAEHTDWGWDGWTAAMWNAVAMVGEYLDFHVQMWQWGQWGQCPYCRPTQKKVLAAQKRLSGTSACGCTAKAS